MLHLYFSKMSGKKQKDILSFWAPKGKPPKKVARLEEETVDEVVAETVEKTPSETVGDTVEESTQETVEEESTQETVEESVDRAGKRKACGADTYRCTFKNEWTTKWPFITKGTSSSYYWCSVCRQENSCAHQGVTDVNRHVKSKGHQSKEQALQSASGIAKFYAPVSVGGITEQESKVHCTYENQKTGSNIG